MINFYPPTGKTTLVFVNTRGQRGKNIPADLHNEKPNKACKKALGHLGPNTSINHIQVVLRSLGTLVPIYLRILTEKTLYP